MLSPEFIREHADEVREALRMRHMDAPVDEVLATDSERRQILQKLEALRA